MIEVEVVHEVVQEVEAQEAEAVMEEEILGKEDQEMIVVLADQEEMEMQDLQEEIMRVDHQDQEVKVVVQEEGKSSFFALHRTLKLCMI